MNKLKWFEYIMLIANCFLSIWLMINLFTVLKELYDYYVPNPANTRFLIEAIVPLVIQIVILSAIIIYFFKLKIAWYCLFLGGIFNIYLVSILLIESFNNYFAYWMMPMPESVETSAIPQFIIDFILVSSTSIFTIVALLLKSPRNKFQIKWNSKYSIISLVMLLTVISLHYYFYSLRFSETGVWGSH